MAGCHASLGLVWVKGGLVQHFELFLLLVEIFQEEIFQKDVQIANGKLLSI